MVTLRWIPLVLAAVGAPAAAQTSSSFDKSSGGSGQAFPDKPVRIVVPYPTGGSTDLVARILGEGATELLGQSIIIDNRSGAGGQTRAVNRVPACGM